MSVMQKLSISSSTENPFIGDWSTILKNKKLLKLLLATCVTPSGILSSNMMPLAPTSSQLPATHKPKIGFSIDSIVGKGEGKDNNRSLRSSGIPSQRLARGSSNDDRDNEAYMATPSPKPSSTDISAQSSNEATAALSQFRGLSRDYPLMHGQFHHPLYSLNNNEMKRGSCQTKPIPIVPSHLPHRQAQSPVSNRSSPNSRPSSVTGNHNSIISSSSKERVQKNNRQVTTTTLSRSPSPEVTDICNKNSRPTSADSNVPVITSETNEAPLSTSLGPPAPLLQASVGPPPGLPQFPPGYPPSMLNFAAAAAAAVAQNHPALPVWMQPPHASHPHHPAAHQLYPWLLAKHSRFFPHRFGPGKTMTLIK